MHPLTTALFSQTAGEGAPATAPGGVAGLLANPMTMIVLMIVVFYFVLLRPQSKEKKKVEAFRASLKKGDRVWTQGGVVGTVYSVDDVSVNIDVGGGNKLRVLKSFVAGEFREKGETAEPSKAEAKK